MFEHETRVGLSDPSLVSQSIEQSVQIIGRGHSGSQSEVERTSQVEALNDPIVVGDKLNQRRSLAIIVEPYVDRRFHRPPELGVIDHRLKADDDASLDEPLHPCTSRVRAQPDYFSELTMCHSTIDLQCTEYFSV